MKKSEIIALIEQTAIKYHKDELDWFGYAWECEGSKEEKMYRRFADESYHKCNAMCKLLDEITGVNGHAVTLDERGEYQMVVI